MKTFLQKKRKEIFWTEKRRNLVFYILLMAIPIAQFCYFYIGVNFNSILMSFQVYDPLTNATEWTFQQYSKLFDDFINLPNLRYAAKNSLILYGVKLGVCMPLALLFSYYIYKGMKCASFFRVVLFLPSMISGIVIVTIFASIADKVIPELSRTIFHKDIWGLLVDPDTKFGTLIFFTIWISFGTNVLMYVDAMKGISPDVVEAAYLEGVSGLKEFWYITLPLIYPTIVTFVTIGLVGIFTDQMSLFSFYGRSADESLVTFGYYMYRELQWATEFSAFENYNYLSAMGIIMTLITVPATIFVRKMMKRFGPSAD